jgi:hypothetical protein
MNRIAVAGIILFANVAGPAMADCSAFDGAMTATAITSLLVPEGNYGTVYSCYNNGTRRENNETLFNGTQFQEYHNGGATVELEGTYTIVGTDSNPGIITYMYNSGGVFAYNICVTPSGSTYQFVNTSTPPNLGIVVSASTSGC